MKKCALITSENLNSTNYRRELIKKSLCNRIKDCLVEFFSGTKIIRINKDNKVEMNIIKINWDRKKSEKGLVKLFEKLVNLEFDIVAFDKTIMKKNNELISKFIVDNNLSIVNGEKCRLSIMIVILKKLMKTRGMDVTNLEVAINTDGYSKFENQLVEYFAGYAKFLTYINSNQERRNNLAEKMLDENGFSLRVCSNISECIGEVGLIINLSENKLDMRKINDYNRIVILDISNEYNNLKKNITVLNGFNIDISSKINIPIGINKDSVIKICEMYLLSKLDNFGENVLLENNIEILYRSFKQVGFKICSLEGNNL